MSDINKCPGCGAELKEIMRLNATPLSRYIYDCGSSGQVVTGMIIAGNVVVAPQLDRLQNFEPSANCVAKQLAASEDRYRDLAEAMGTTVHQPHENLVKMVQEQAMAEYDLAKAIDLIRDLASILKKYVLSSGDEDTDSLFPTGVDALNKAGVSILGAEKPPTEGARP